MNVFDIFYFFNDEESLSRLTNDKDLVIDVRTSVALKFILTDNNLNVFRFFEKHVSLKDRRLLIQTVASAKRSMMLRYLLRKKEYLIEVTQLMVIDPFIFKQLKIVTKLSTRRDIVDYINVL